MRIQLSWLQEFVELPASEELERCLVEAGLTVDHKDDPSSALSGVVVVQVVSAEPHPRADRLKVCEVDDGSRRWQVVCGAPNVAAGQRAAHARPGVKMPAGMTLAVRPLRGVDSHGMLCAREELGLLPAAGEAGIWVLPDDAPLGSPAMAQAASAAVWSLSVTPNRPDMLSYMGVAREVAATAGRRPKNIKARAPEKGPDIGTLARVQVEEPLACRRFLVRAVRNLRVGPSPDWVVARLLSHGVRSVNNVVDATQMVCFEQGVPLHAYDLARLAVQGATPRIWVRRAQADERLQGLDGRMHRLADQDMVVADLNGPVSVCGIVGGRPTGVHAGTSSILLEAAVIDPARVRATARRLGLRTESSLRGERGVDPQQAQRALDRCCQLIAEWTSGDVAKGVLEHASPLARVEIPLRLARVARVLGVTLSPELVVQLLDPLEVRCVTRTDQALIFEVPSFRPDISREIDLIEEVARRHGMGRLPSRRPSTGQPFVFAPATRNLRRLARDTMLAGGLSECVTYAFGRPAWYGGDEGPEVARRAGAPADARPSLASNAGAAAKPGATSGASPAAADLSRPITLMNPLGEANSVLRTSLLPGLLAAVAHNLRHGRRDLRLFEAGVTFHRRQPQADEDARQRLLPLEVERLAWCLQGGRHAGRWYERGAAADLSCLVGVAEMLVEALRLAAPLRVVPQTVAGFLPGMAAELWVGDTLMGVAGALQPEICARSGLTTSVLAGELSLTTLAAQRLAARQVPPLGRHPSVRRDVAWIVPAELAAEALAAQLWAEAGGELGPQVVEAVRLFDRYVGAPVPDGKVSLAYAVDYRHPDRTLTDREVSEAFAGAVARIGASMPVVVR